MSLSAEQLRFWDLVDSELRENERVMERIHPTYVAIGRKNVAHARKVLAKIRESSNA